ncbi:MULTISPECIES: hypothetical protein [unclassified Mesorhizobium]|uniref:hypothetical protein n=1 Tax=unclassified Mesorhizobium TaxID=325217 RepID=UPI00167B0AE8|nr:MULTISPECIES: hypothetical protein [unclassified Mesorhizobium]
MEDILLWGAVLCLTFIAGAAIYFELPSSKTGKHPSAGYGFGRRSRSRRPKTKR